MENFKIYSLCKINLTLRILKKINKNLHDIESLITFCKPYDEILVKRINSSKDKIIFSGKFKSRIDKKYNTVTKVLSLLRKNNFLKNKKFLINVKKNIPHGSGLGGGSSNSAALLNFFNLKMNLKIKKNKINKIASFIGFDTPINLVQKNTLIPGNKRKMIRIKNKFNFNILLIYPNIVCSTKKIYQKNENFSSSTSRIKFYLNNKKKLINFLSCERNDLQKTVFKFYPKIKKIVEFVNSQKGCYFSRITGSGSTIIGIFSNAKLARNTQKSIKLKFPKYWCEVSKTI